MSLINHSPMLRLDYQPIDHDHSEFISLLNQLATSDNPDFPTLFLQLYQHTERHFEFENQLMHESGFPAEREHKSEHVRVLAEFKQFQSRIDKGLIGFGRSFVQERLPAWFSLHLATMDSALAAHLKTIGTDLYSTKPE